MTARPLFALAILLLAAGCDESQPTNSSRPIVVRSEAQEQLHQLNDLNRAIGLKRAIQSSGFRCQRVDKSGYVQEHNNLSMWTATCEKNQQWAIFVGPDGTAQVRRCTELAQLGLPACVIKPRAKAPA